MFVRTSIRYPALILMFTLVGMFLIPTPGYSVESVDSLKATSINLSSNLLDLKALRKAFMICERILERSPDDFQTMTLYSRLCWSIGSQEEENFQKEWFGRGRDMGKKIKEKYPNKPDGYYWYTVNYGEWVDRSSIFQKIGAKKVIMTDMNKVLELDDTYDSGGAYIIIGRINYIAPGGSYEKAIECFEKAMKIGPRRTTAYLFLGELYLHEHVFDKAEELFQHVLSMDVDPRFAIEARMDRTQARKYLKKSDRKDDFFPKQPKIIGK